MAQPADHWDNYWKMEFPNSSKPADSSHKQLIQQPILQYLFYFPYYPQIENITSAISTPKTIVHKSSIIIIISWLPYIKLVKKIKRENHEISYEEYLNWKLNYEIKGEDRIWMIN